MRWLSISALSSAVGYAGMKVGTMLISPTAGLWLSFLAGLAGLWVGLYLFPKRD